MQLTRILRSFDGVRTWEFDVNGDGQPDLAGDFDGDGTVDVGGDAPIYISGGSLGGIMSVVTASMDPNITGAAPIAGGGGLTDVAARSKQGGVREAVTLRVMGPLYVGTQAADGDEMVLETIIPDVNDTATERFAAVAARAAGDTVVVENLVNGTRGCGRVWEDAAGRLVFRAAVEASFEDAVRVSFFAGDPLVLGTADCELVAGAAPDRVVDTFEVAVDFQARSYPAESPLRALAEGMGRKRATPGFRRFSQLGQLVLDPADPAVLVPHALEEPLTYPGTGETTGSHMLIITTMGDMNVPASGGLTQARAAGLVDFLTPDPRYGVPPNQVLIDNHVAEAVHTLGRYRTPSGDPVHKDVENFALGQDPWGDTIPRIDTPLHLGFDKTDALGGKGKSAAVFPYTVPTGQHGFMFPGQMWDYARKQCQAACPDGQACDCGATDGFDIGNFMFNMIGRWFASEAEILDVDQCMSRDDCAGIPAPPAPRGAARL